MEVVEDQRRALRRDRLELGEKGLDRIVAGRTARSEGTQDRRRSRREVRVVLAAGRHQVRQEADPIPIIVVEPVPDRPEPGPAREVREERRLAVAGVGDHEEHAAVDLRLEPVEQARARKDLVAQRGRLNFSRLDRVAHAGASLGADAVGRRSHRAARADRDRRTRGRPPSWTERDRIGRRERYGRRSSTVNDRHGTRIGHAGHGAARPSPPAYLGRLPSTGATVRRWPRRVPRS